MLDQRCPLIPGSQLQFSEDHIYQITGVPIGFGGGSLIYPVIKLVLRDGSWVSDGFEYVLKECYPVSSGHKYIRNDTGEIVPEHPSQEEFTYLNNIQQMMLTESRLSQTIYKTASRIIPIRDSAMEFMLFRPEKQRKLVHNTITIMDSLRLKGCALTDHIREQGCLSPIQAFHVVQQLLPALQEVHQAGYLHLDIQDGNIFIKGTLEGENNLATLIDFGSARPMCSEGKTEMIVDRMIFSTPGYSAPEIRLHNDGTLRLGPEADIYSVGCLLLHMLTGSRADVNALDRNTSGKYLTRFRLRNIRCPAHLVEPMQAIIAHALAREPENRYHSVEEMLEDVNDLVRNLQPHRNDLSSVEYDAFICYKHGTLDSAAARTLQQKLEHFRDPRKNSKKRYPFHRVFMDEGELSSCANYPEMIRTALKNSGWLIVICSPDTPKSNWVSDEINAFLEYHDRSHMLAVLVDGEPEQSFPKPLLGNDNAVGEVLAADARGKDINEVLRKIKKDSILRIAAPMLGVPYDSLRQRRKMYMMKRFSLLTAFALILASAFSVYSVIQKSRLDKQYDAVLVRESRYLSEVAESALEMGDRTEAINIALLALPNIAQDRPYVANAERVLSEALHTYVCDQELDYDMKLSMNDSITDMIICEDIYLCAVTENNWIGVFNTTDGACLWQKKLTDIIDDASSFSEIESVTYDAVNGNLIMVSTGHLICIDLQSSTCVWIRELYSYGNIAYCLQGDRLCAFPYGYLVPNSLIYCYSLADGTDIGTYSIDMSSYISSQDPDLIANSDASIRFDSARIYVDDECRAVIAATPSEYGSSAHFIFCIYDFRSKTTHILERTDEFLGFLPEGEDYYLASAERSDAEANRYDLLRIAKIKLEDDAPECVWEKQYTLSSPLSSYQLPVFEESIPIWNAEDYLSLNIENEFFAIALSDGSLLSQYTNESDIASIHIGSTLIIMEEDGGIWEHYPVNYWNFIRIAELGRDVSELTVGSDYLAVLPQEQAQSIYIIRSLGDKQYSAIFQDQTTHNTVKKALLSPDENHIFFISNYDDGENQGVFGQLVDLENMEKLSGWYFDEVNTYTTDFLQLSTEGSELIWMYDDCLFKTNLYTGETIAIAEEIGYFSPIVAAPFESGQPARMVMLNWSNGNWPSDGSENYRLVNEFCLQYFEDGVLRTEACYTMEKNDPLYNEPELLSNSLCVGNNGYCTFNATEDVLIVCDLKQGTFEECDGISAVDEQSIACLASENPWYAYIDLNGTLRILDIASKKTILTMDGFEFEYAWSCFSADDEFLFILTDSGALTVINMETQSICYYLELEIDYGNESMQLLEGDGVYFLYYSKGSYVNDGYIISRSEMEVCSHLQKTLGFIPAQNSVLVYNYSGGVALYPIHELNKLTQMGIRIIAKQPLSEKECIESNIDYAYYSEVYAKWMQFIETESTETFTEEYKIINISSDDPTKTAVVLPTAENVSVEVESEEVRDIFLTEQEDGSVLVTWIDEPIAHSPYSLSSYYGYFELFSDELQYFYLVTDELYSNSYLIDDLLPDTQYTILLRLADANAVGEYIHTSATADYSKGDVCLQGAMLLGKNGENVLCTDTWSLANIQQQCALNDLRLICVFDTTADCPSGEKNVQLRITAPNGTVIEKALSIDLQSDMLDQQIDMDCNVFIFLGYLEESLAYIPTGTYTVDLYLERQHLGNASFSIEIPDI